MVTFDSFSKEFGELQQMIVDGKIQLATSQNLENLHKMNDKPNRAEKQEKAMRIYQSMSPRLNEIKEKETIKAKRKAEKADKLKITRKQTLDTFGELRDPNIKHSDTKKQT